MASTDMFGAVTRSVTGGTIGAVGGTGYCSAGPTRDRVIRTDRFLTRLADLGAIVTARLLTVRALDGILDTERFATVHTLPLVSGTKLVVTRCTGFAVTVAGRFVAGVADTEVARTVVVLAVVALACVRMTDCIVTLRAGLSMGLAVLVVADATGREVVLANPAVAVCAVCEVIVAEPVAAVSTRGGVLLAEVFPTVATRLDVLWAEFVAARGTGGGVLGSDRVVAGVTVRRVLVTVPAVTIITRDAVVDTDIFGTGRARPSVSITDRRVVNHTHSCMVRTGVTATDLACLEVLNGVVSVAVLAVP